MAAGTRIVPISGQTAVDARRKDRRQDHRDPCRQALRSLRTALEAAGATLADVAKVNIYMVDYGDAALRALMIAAARVFGDPYLPTANTLIGVASPCLPGCWSRSTPSQSPDSAHRTV
ncbi:MAG TPA: RidA family protein [Acidimicrobiales bacterium]|nr:RidA family protein [Acidimicrobiales bacterium]